MRVKTKRKEGFENVGRRDSDVHNNRLLISRSHSCSQKAAVLLRRSSLLLSAGFILSAVNTPLFAIFRPEVHSSRLIIQQHNLLLIRGRGRRRRRKKAAHRWLLIKINKNWKRQTEFVCFQTIIDYHSTFKGCMSNQMYIICVLRLSCE